MAKKGQFGIQLNRVPAWPLPWETAQFLIDKGQEELESGATRIPYLLFLVGFYTGFRWSDIRWLQFKDFDSDRLVRIEKKTGKPRSIMIHPRLSEGVNFARYRLNLQGDDYLFWEPIRKALRVKNQKRLAPISHQGACFIVGRYFKKYAVDGLPTMHTMRKTFALRVYEQAGKTEEALVLVSTILNHEDTATTRTYIGLFRESKRVQKAYLSL